MKTLFALFAAVLLTISVSAQSPTTPITNIYMGGASYNANGTVPVAVTATYGHKLVDGTYAFSMIDVLPNSTNPFTVTSNVAFGVAQKLLTIAGMDILVPTTAGVSWSGPNVGWAWGTGAAVPIYIKSYKGGNFYAMPSVRVLKSSVSNGTGYQPILGVQFGWGQTE